MLSDPQVWAAIPPNGFIAKYVRWGREWIETNSAFHLVAGLTLLAQTVPYRYASRDASPMHANVYGLLAGPSSEAGKTKSILAARHVLKLSELPELEQPNSPEVLIDDLKNENQILLYDEFGQFLKSTETGHMEPIRMVLTNAYDCTPQSRATVKARNSGKVKTAEPRLSILAGGTPGFLEDFTTSVDWTEGFLARFFTVYSSRSGKCREFDESCEIERREIADLLRSYIAAKESVGDPFSESDAPQACAGMSRAAKVLWDDWTGRLTLRVKGAPKAVRAALNRAEGHAKKAMLLVAWDSGDARSGRSWLVSEDDVGAAIALTELHIQSVIEIAENLAPNRDGRDVRSLLNAFDLSEPRTLGQALCKLGFELNKRRAIAALDTLLEMKLVKQCEERLDTDATYTVVRGKSNVVAFRKREDEAKKLEETIVRIVDDDLFS